MGTGIRLRSAMHLLVICALLLGLYLISMPRLITLEDAGLFQMVCHFNGIAHPPGYPLFTLLCSGTSKIPYLDPVLSGNLLSAIFAVLAACLVFHIVWSITRELTAAYVAALGLGASAGFWSQAIIIEVYSLNVFLFALLVLLALRYVETSRTAILYWGAFVYGLALSNHWPLILLATPGLLVILWQAKSDLLGVLSRSRTWFYLFVALLLGLAPYLSIPLKQQPFISLYGPIGTFHDLLSYVARSAYGDGMSSADWSDKSNYLVWLSGEVSRQFGWVAGIGILLGIIISFGSLSRLLNAGLWLIFLGGTLVLMLLVHFEYYYLYRAVFRVYPLISYMVLSIWLGVAVKTIVNLVAVRWPRFDSLPVKVFFVAAMVLTVVSANYHAGNRSADSFAEDYGRLVLSSLEPNANLFVNGDNETGPIGYLHHVKGLRPDIDLYSSANVVFNNPLASPHDNKEHQNSIVREFIYSSEKPSYVLSPALGLSGIDYGLFIEHLPGRPSHNDREYVFNDTINSFLQQLLSNYEENRIVDPHSLSFAHTLLLRFTRQYVGYAFEHDPDIPLSEDFLKMMYRLQRTFPGRLVTLGYLLNNHQPTVSKFFMAELVVEGLNAIPDEVSLRNHSLFYEYAGHVALLDAVEFPADKLLAISYFERSLELFPYPDNVSGCLLQDLYKAEDDRSKLSVLEKKFSKALAQCKQSIIKGQL